MYSSNCVSRRALLRWAGVLTPLAVLGKAEIPIAVQLFGVRDECEKDLPGVLRQLAKFGYQAVEFAGFYGHSANDVRHMLDDVSLRCCGSHTPLDQLTPERFDQTVAFNSAV
ncbi:MAG: hypothetical protein JO022_09695, partial [Acidobacteriaceae bacterium]|nr:hypothetical protein [Acidobacteriaceae bacterium]